MLVDSAGKPLDDKRPSAEIQLHVQIYRRYEHIHAVLHPHSVNATLLSRLHSHCLVLQDYELLKAFAGIGSHECQVTVPVFANDQDISRLAAEVEKYMNDSHEPIFGYLIAGHGFYTWGRDVEETLRHIEAFEFLFECEMRLHGVISP